MDKVLTLFFVALVSSSASAWQGGHRFDPAPHEFGPPRPGFDLPPHIFGPPSHNFGQPHHHFKPPRHWPCGSSSGSSSGSISRERDSDSSPSSSESGSWEHWGHGKYPRPKPQPKPKPPKPTPASPPTPWPSSTTLAPPIPTVNPPFTTPVTPPIKTDRPGPLTPEEELEKCMRNCPHVLEYKPVCGTDGVTYMNMAYLACAKFCGVAVELAQESKCPVLPYTTQSPETSSSAITSNPGPSPKIDPLVECLRGCSVTSEYNPVCGTDGKTYNNLSRLQCARFCGVDVRLFRKSKCSTGPTTPTVTTLGPSTPSNEAVQACMVDCRTTSEYNPVCGTNGVTYSNPGRLECAKFCGVDVKLFRASRCPAQGSSTSAPSTGKTQPPVTPPPFTPAPVTPPPFTPPPVTPSPGPTVTTGNGLDFTIPKEILDMVFSGESDGAGGFDERYQDIS